MKKNKNYFLNFTDFLNTNVKKYEKDFFYMSKFKKKQITYSKLLTIIKNFRKVISRYSLNGQDKIVVICDNSENLVLIFLSILYHMLVFVPINPNSTIIELNYILKKINPKIIITTKLLAKKFKITKNILFIEEYEKIKKNRENFHDNKYEILLKNKDPIAQILFTSGSTGNPKGVVLTHQSMLHNLYGIFNSIKIKGKDLNFLSVTPLYHNNGQFIPTLLPILIGGKTLSISPDASLINFWHICKKFKINYSSVMSTHINYFNSFKNKKKNNLKLLFCGGAKLDANSQINFEKKFKVKVLCNYGLTETSSIACTESISNNLYAYGSVGKPLKNNQIKILKKRRADEFGEILIKGKNIFKEYLNDKKLTIKTKKEGWLRTGDLGHFDKKGFLYIKDRIDNMVVVSGENIYPSEIENLIYKFKKIRLGIITSIPDKITQNKLVLVYESKNKIGYSEIFNFLSKKISKYKIPKIILSCNELGIEEIPKAANKKVLRKKLKLIVLKLFK